jgi:acetyl-CoA C-acetyltransferase
VPIADAADGSAVIETYTVVYDRTGAPVRGIVLGRLDDGRRILANTPPERSGLEAFAASEQVARRGRVHATPSGNVFE